MFTGIVETAGTVASIAPTEGRTVLSIECGALGAHARIGESISVNGACLTVTGLDDGRLAVDVVPETLSRTSLGALKVGSRVNLERAMVAGGRLDGHIVQGHVDGVGTVTSLVAEGDGFRLTIDLPESLRRYVVEKGSLCVDGVSLTVASVDDDSCAIALIPHTLEVTTLGLLSSGDPVNLEVDVIAKYVERLLDARRG